MSDLHKSDSTHQVAWCWASGLVEIGDCTPDNAIQIASGPKRALGEMIDVVCRHGQGASTGKYLVSGVPEADDQFTAFAALKEWLKWCAKSRTNDGVTFEVLT